MLYYNHAAQSPILGLPRRHGGKESLPADTEDSGLIPWWRRSPGVGNGNPLQYSCLENAVDRVGWQTTTHGSAESDTAVYAHPLVQSSTVLGVISSAYIY